MDVLYLSFVLALNWENPAVFCSLCDVGDLKLFGLHCLTEHSHFPELANTLARQPTVVKWVFPIDLLHAHNNSSSLYLSVQVKVPRT